MSATQIFAAIGGSAFLIIAIVGGLRLLLLARQTRKLPEFVLGGALVILGGLQTPLAALAKMPLDASLEGIRVPCYVGHAVLLVLGLTGIGAFNWIVFRPGERWAQALAVGFALWMTGCFLAVVAFDGVAMAIRDEGYAVQLFGGSTLVPLFWSAYESGRFSVQLKRRRKLGLADPVVANRILLWAVAMGIATALSGLVTLDGLVGEDLVGTPIGTAIIGSLGSVAALALYLAFLPPKSYLQWIRTPA